MFLQKKVVKNERRESSQDILRNALRHRNGNYSHLPEYVTKSPSWKKINDLNQELNKVSSSYLKYEEYLRRVKY